MAYFFLHCHNFMRQRQTLLDSISQVHDNILKLNKNLLTDTLLFGNPKYSVSVNSKISNFKKCIKYQTSKIYVTSSFYIYFYIYNIYSFIFSFYHICFLSSFFFVFVLTIKLYASLSRYF